MPYYNSIYINRTTNSPAISITDNFQDLLATETSNTYGKGITKFVLGVDGASKEGNTSDAAFSIGDNFYISHAEGTGKPEDFNIFFKGEDNNYYFYANLDFEYFSSDGCKYNYNGCPSTYEVPVSSGAVKSKSDLDCYLATQATQANTSNANTLTDSDNAKKALSEDEKQLASNIYGSKTSLVGTVYSKKGNIKINIGATAFDILGALITCKGDLDITASKVDLKYDPDYVPFFKDIGIQTKLRFLSSFVGGEN